MGFFSFGKKDDAPRRRSATSTPARSGAAFEGREARRTRRSERAGDADAMLLDPTLPEKQRARRRLVGAIALVVAAIVILPMVLDSHPKPVTDDIAIDIPNRPATVPSRASDDRNEDMQAGVAPDTAGTADTSDTSDGSGTAVTGIAPAPAATATTKPGKTAQASSGAKATAPAAPLSTRQAESKPAPAKQAQSEKATVVPAPSPAQADSGTPAAPPGARFALQLGVFADDARARGWETKLKAAGVPAYVEHRKQADGKTRAWLLAGPFADRAAASAAIAKVRGAGLTSSTGNGAQ
jgi:DedD protein